jgi:2,3-bisphosphoglycerate-dependent phosphoglycerate mutase
MKQTSYQFTLLRHGESVANADNIFQGQNDFPLTQRGIKQSRALAEMWKNQKITFDQVISSPLSRAQQTTEIIAEQLNLDIEFNPLWMERDIGKLSGLNRTEAEINFPRPGFIPLYMQIGETGESIWDLYLRAGRAVQDLLRRHPGRFLVVSHGGILNMVLYTILGITPQPNFHGARFRFDNTAYATLIFNPLEHDWLLESLNRREHWLEDEGQG